MGRTRGGGQVRRDRDGDGSKKVRVKIEEGGLGGRERGENLQRHRVKKEISCLSLWGLGRGRVI